MATREQNLKKTTEWLKRQTKQSDCPECIKNMAKLFGTNPAKKK